MRLIFGLVLLGGAALIVWRIRDKVRSASKIERTSTYVGHAPRIRFVGLPILLLGIIGEMWWASATYISASQGGVVENQTTASLTRIDKGLYVWPFSLKVTPLITSTSKYSFSSKNDGDNSLTLGVKDDLAKRVASASNSPGNPTVYFWAKVVAVPDREQLTTLHRRYGGNYLDGYVKGHFESALKTIQGRHEFNYVANNRSQFEEEVRVELERRLGLETDGIPLVRVAFVNILDYDYDGAVNEQLNKIVQAENQAREAKARVITAEEEANAVKKKADGDQYAAITKAEGEKQSANKQADALLYAKEKEAEGIKVVQAALASSPTYIQLQQVQRWNGALPVYMGGDGVIPFFNLPDPTTAGPQTPTR